MAQRSYQLLMALALTLALSSNANAALLELDVVAATAVQYDWLPEGAMLDVYPSALGNMYPVSNQAGHLAFAASLRGQSIVFNVNDAALFRRTPDGAIAMVLQKGDQVPGLPDGAKWFEFLPTCLADDGTLFFRGQLDWVNGGGGVSQDNDYLVGRVAPDGSLAVLAREGSTVPGLGGYLFTSQQFPAGKNFQPRCTAGGEAVFAHGISLAGSSESALIHVDAEGSVSVAHRSGQAAPGFAFKEEFLGFPNAHRINNSGQLVFDATLQTGDGGEYVGTGNDTALFGPGENGLTTKIAREGDAAPGSPDGKFENIDDKDSRAIGAGGKTYFIADYKYDNWYVASALYRHDPADPGTLAPLMVEQTPAPGFEDGWDVGYLNAVQVNAEGRMSVSGEVWFGEDDWGDPLFDESVIWVTNDANEVTVLMATGDTAPGTGGAKVQTLNDILYMNAGGQTVFAGTLTPAEPVTNLNDYCVFRHTPGAGTDLFMREGTVVAIADGDERTTQFIGMTSFGEYGSGGADGMQRGLRDDGTALFRLSFLGDPPQPGFSSNVAIVIADLKDDPCDPEKVNCDDEDACTQDSCEPETGCIHTPIDCDDEDACTVDSCDEVEGCLHADLDCDDVNACTTDSCDAALGCQYVDVTCDDQDACTEDSCDEVDGCTYEDIDCDDSDACTTDSCDVDAGCQYVDVVCNDDSACTEDSCDVALGCQFSDVDCDDDNACTTDSCDVDAGCQHQDIDCNDNDACTIDNCEPIEGCQYAAIDCDDDSVCTNDSCNPDTGCQYADVGCDDDNACTIDSCDAQEGCQTAPVECDDGNACTTDSCDTDEGCQHEQIVCDDGDACTTDFCDADNGCEFTEVKCDDNVACTIDTCDSQTGCVFTDMVCDDDSPCTIDSCELGECVFKKDPEQPNCCVNAGDCHDGDPCTTDSCVEQLCEYSDVDDCCTKDLDCSDGNVCTVDLCDQATNQCKYQDMAGCCMSSDDCDDGQACIEYECVEGVCLACESDEDCLAAGTSCVALPSGSYCLHDCGDGCAQGFTCVDDACVPDEGDCECVEDPATYGCDGGNWTAFDTCGQYLETVEECPFECAPKDGCCDEGEEVAEGYCGGETTPEGPETDIVTQEDVIEPAEEVIEAPDSVVEEDAPVPAEDTGTTPGDDDLTTPGAEIVEEDGGDGSGGGGGCSTSPSPSSSGGLLLGLLALLLVARVRRETR